MFVMGNVMAAVRQRGCRRTHSSLSERMVRSVPRRWDETSSLKEEDES